MNTQNKNLDTSKTGNFKANATELPEEKTQKDVKRSGIDSINAQRSQDEVGQKSNLHSSRLGQKTEIR